MRTTVSVAVDDSLCGVTDSGHNITMDMSPDVGGRNQGPRPMEMLLLGMGGCTLIDVMLILRKSRQEFSALRVELEAARADDIPKVFTRIHAHFVVSGDNLDSKKVSRAINLSADKYCSASKMLGAVAQITHDFEICPD
mgnify:FL=1